MSGGHTSGGHMSGGYTSAGKERSMLVRIAVAVMIMAATIHWPAGVLRAQPERLEVGDADSVKIVLERQVGKRVAVILSTGQELNGVVIKVARDLLHLSELGGREFNDAVIPLDRINAVVIRVRSR
jgi:hypothetical protein